MKKTVTGSLLAVSKLFVDYFTPVVGVTVSQLLPLTISELQRLHLTGKHKSYMLKIKCVPCPSLGPKKGAAVVQDSTTHAHLICASRRLDVIVVVYDQAFWVHRGLDNTVKVCAHTL